jgi:hypothetical protein
MIPNAIVTGTSMNDTITPKGIIVWSPRVGVHWLEAENISLA